MKLQLIFGFMLLFSAKGYAVDDIFDIPLLEATSVSLDGQSTEEVWQQAADFSLDFEISPQRVVATDWVTRGKIFHDGVSLFIWIAATDPESDRIRALESSRDRVSGSEDAIIILLDPGPSKRRVINLTTNARGTQADRISSSFGESSFRWSGEWKSAVHRDDQGYYVELQIPFNTIGAIINEDGGLSIGFNVIRQIGRDRREQLSLSPVDLFEPCTECQYSTISLKNAEAIGSDWRITPYVVTTANQETLSSGASENDYRIDAGLDVLWKRGGTDRLLLTLNPDFSQVDIDGVQFDINRRFPIFFSENRPFFTEDSGIYRTPLNIIDTRVILEPQAGGQYLRNSTNTRIGIFLTDDEFTTFLIPGLETSSRVNLGTGSLNLASHALWNQSDKLTVGGLVTARKSSNGYSNVVAGSDGTFQITDRQKLTWQAVISQTDNPAYLQEEFALDESQSDMAFRLAHQYGGTIYRSYTRLEYVGGDFRADLGRINLVGVQTFIHRSSLNFTGEEESYVTNWGINASYSQRQAIGGNVLRESIRVSSYGSFRDESNINFRLTRNNETFNNVSFDLSGISAGYGFTPKDRLNIFFGGSLNDDIDMENLDKGEDLSYYAGFSFTLEPSLEVSLFMSQSEFNNSVQRLFSVDSLEANFTYNFNLNHHIKGVLSYGELKLVDSRDAIAQYQLTYRYEPGPFTRFILGASGTSNSEAGFSSLKSERLFVFAKLSYTF